MSNLFTAQNIFDFAIALGIIIYAIAQWQNGKSDKKSGEDNETLVTIKLKDLTIETLQKENKDISERLAKQGERMAVLESDNKRLEAIVANRNPELEQFIANTTKSLSSILETNKIILETIHSLLAKTSTTVINNSSPSGVKHTS